MAQDTETYSDLAIRLSVLAAALVGNFPQALIIMYTLLQQRITLYMYISRSGGTPKVPPKCPQTAGAGLYPTMLPILGLRPHWPKYGSIR
jgi:hypothetical protein